MVCSNTLGLVIQSNKSYSTLFSQNDNVTTHTILHEKLPTVQMQVSAYKYIIVYGSWDS